MRRASVLLLLAGCAAPSEPVKAPAPAPPVVAAAEQAAAPVTVAAPPIVAPETPRPQRGRVVRNPSVREAPATLVGKDPLADEVLTTATSTVLKTVLAAPETYRFQVLYGVINTTGAKPKLERHGWRADAEYFFPASSMKVPIALAAYERMAAQRKAGKAAFTRDATLNIFPSSGNGAAFSTTLARETWRALIVSDNFSANRLLAITGHREVNETCWGLGLASTRVRTGFATGDEIDPAEVSPRVAVVPASGTPVELPARKSTLTLPANDAKSLEVGAAYIDEKGRKVPSPMPFKEKNAMRLQHLQDALIRIMRPELMPPPAGAARGSIYASATENEDVAYLREALGTLPSESGLAGYDRNILSDYPLSPFLRGIERVRSRKEFQIFQKVGQAYGFLIHNTYVVEKATGKAFFLAAAIYANADGVLNDDLYNYETVSFPALADVGEAFARDAFED